MRSYMLCLALLSLMFIANYSQITIAQDELYNPISKPSQQESLGKVVTDDDLSPKIPNKQSNDNYKLRLSKVLIDYNKYNLSSIKIGKKPNLKQKLNSSNTDYHNLILLGGEAFIDRLYDWFLRNEMLVFSPYQDRKTSKIYYYIYQQIATADNKVEFVPDISTAAYNASYEFFNYILLYKELNKKERLQFRKYFSQLLINNF